MIHTSTPHFSFGSAIPNKSESTKSEISKSCSKTLVPMASSADSISSSRFISKISSLEKSIDNINKEHARLLNELYQEVKRLQNQCSDLTLKNSILAAKSKDAIESESKRVRVEATHSDMLQTQKNKYIDRLNLKDVEIKKKANIILNLNAQIDMIKKVLGLAGLELDMKELKSIMNVSNSNMELKSDASILSLVSEANDNLESADIKSINSYQKALPEKSSGENTTEATSKNPHPPSHPPYRISPRCPDSKIKQYIDKLLLSRKKRMTSKQIAEIVKAPEVIKNTDEILKKAALRAKVSEINSRAVTALKEWSDERKFSSNSNSISLLDISQLHQRFETNIQPSDPQFQIEQISQTSNSLEQDNQSSKNIPMMLLNKKTPLPGISGKEFESFDVTEDDYAISKKSTKTELVSNLELISNFSDICSINNWETDTNIKIDEIPELLKKTKISKARQILNSKDRGNLYK